MYVYNRAYCVSFIAEYFQLFFPPPIALPFNFFRCLGLGRLLSVTSPRCTKASTLSATSRVLNDSRRTPLATAVEAPPLRLFWIPLFAS
jgi:hypothetical protein